MCPLRIKFVLFCSILKACHYNTKIYHCHCSKWLKVTYHVDEVPKTLTLKELMCHCIKKCAYRFFVQAAHYNPQLGFTVKRQWHNWHNCARILRLLNSLSISTIWMKTIRGLWHFLCKKRTLSSFALSVYISREARANLQQLVSSGSMPHRAFVSSVSLESLPWAWEMRLNVSFSEKRDPAGDTAGHC